MLCNECNKNPASLHLTQIVNGEMTEIQVCEPCAKKLGYLNQYEDSYTLQDLLSSLFHIAPSQIEMKGNPLQSQFIEGECPKCHLTFKDFQRIGKFGCADCYHTFKPKLGSIFRKVHSGNTEHQGKVPKRQGINLHKKREISRYRSELNQLIQEENFEQAAIIRDKIKSIEQDGLGDES